MSIINRTHPLNLQYRVCVVTSAFSPLGTIICKTLLKANALVLGVDTRPCDPSLNAGLGTHFQCESCDVDDAESAERVLRAVEEKFGAERVDGLVNIVEEGREVAGLERFAGQLAEVMGREGRGAVVNVFEDVDGLEEGRRVELVMDMAKKLAAQYGESGVRSTVVLPGFTGDADSTGAYEEAKTHMTALMKTERAAQQAVASPEPRLYDIANVTLFLAGDMGENVSGAVVGLDGSYRYF